MSVAERTPSSASLGDWPLRLGITALALLIYRLGCHLPVPGLNPQLLPAIVNSERCSIFALGVTPLFAALALAELLKTLVPSVRRWEQAEHRRYGPRDFGSPGFVYQTGLFQPLFAEADEFHDDSF